MTLDAQTIVSASIPVIGVVVWLVRLEGRISAQEQMQTRISNDVAYIRERVDRALNGHD